MRASVVLLSGIFFFSCSNDLPSYNNGSSSRAKKKSAKRRPSEEKKTVVVDVYMPPPQIAPQPRRVVSQNRPAQVVRFSAYGYAESSGRHYRSGHYRGSSRFHGGGQRRNR